MNLPVIFQKMRLIASKYKTRLLKIRDSMKSDILSTISTEFIHALNILDTSFRFASYFLIICQQICKLRFRTAL